MTMSSSRCPNDLKSQVFQEGFTQNECIDSPIAKSKFYYFFTSICIYFMHACIFSCAQGVCVGLGLRMTLDVFLSFSGPKILGQGLSIELIVA